MNIHDTTIKAIESARADYDEDISHLSPGGRPLYAPDIMAAKTAAIRAAYLAEIARLEDRARTALTAAERKLADGRGDPYQWLSDDELRRANLLAPFVKEDIERGAATAPTGDRARAWLLWRAAAAGGESGAAELERAAWPDDLHAADETITLARAALSAVDMAHPDFTAGVLARYGIQSYSQPA